MAVFIIFGGGSPPEISFNLKNNKSVANRTETNYDSSGTDKNQIKPV